MGDFTIFQVLFFLAFFAILTFSFFNMFRTIRAQRINSKMPRIKAHCTIISHRKEDMVQGRGGYNNTRYYLTLEYETGDQCEYSVTSDAYTFYVDGDSGMVTVRGNEFITFELDRNG